ncbi:MAG: hypothetical protein PHE03_07380 [Bacteroidales bacterium]|nr:hypothetical protein [Bacteroidales bacterium]MDD3892109.1 hypothetical protein [Bacteroidales bacterium]
MEPIRTTTEGQVTGIIGIVLGIIALIVAFIPCIGVVAFLPGGLAIIFSVISIVQASKGNGSKGLGIAALIVSVLATLLAAAWLLLFSGLSIIANESMKDPTTVKRIEQVIKEAFNDEEDDLPSKQRIDSLENRLRAIEKEKDNEKKEKE